LARNSDITLDRALVADTVHVLLVEDNLAEGRFLREILWDKWLARLDLVYVQRLTDAIAALQQRSFDVVLLDLTLPDSQGLESLDRLRQDYPQLPIVVLTNTNDNDLAVEAVRHGAQDYLVKRQVNADVLVRSLCYAIERQQSADALQAVNESLEQRVQERTAELAATNARLTQEIAERERLEAQFLRAQRLESLGTLATGIAHDMNNVLTPILSVSQLLPMKLPELDPPTRHLLQVMEESAHRGSALVKQILAFVRGVEGNRAPVSMPDLLREVVQILQQTLPKTIGIQLDCAADLGSVYGDVTQLHQVLMNLAVNARDAMPEGGQLVMQGTLQMLQTLPTLPTMAALPDVDVQPGAYVVITVRDTGVGMDAAVLDRMFDPFFSTKAIGRGTGLGLSAVLGIVKSHGGFIDVQSEVGEGTTFQIFLPADQWAANCATSHPDLLCGHQEMVLVVDDEVAIREIMQVTLESYNYRVMTAVDGLEAIERCRQHADQINLLLIDLMMPRMDGFATISAIHQICPQTPAIAMSGVSPTDIVHQAEVMGFQRFLTKPFSTQELLRVLQMAITSG
jgi:signal transduction histidine kinase